MNAKEICQNCGKQIGSLEHAMVFNDHEVCEACHAILVRQKEIREPEIEDLSSPFPPEPKHPLFSITSIKYVPMRLLKIVMYDADTNETVSGTIDLPIGMTLQEVGAAAERSSGKKLLKITILKQYWEETHPVGALEKGLYGIAALSLISDL